MADTQQNQTQKKTLDLTQLAETTTVRFRDKSGVEKTVEIRSLDQLTPVELARISRIGKRLEALLTQQESCSDAELAELETLPADLCKLVGGGATSEMSPDDQWRLCRSFTHPRSAIEPTNLPTAPTSDAADVTGAS